LTTEIAEFILTFHIEIASMSERNKMKYRIYDPEKDKKAVNRIWLETGWIKKDDPKPMDILIEGSRTIVADINDNPECLVVSALGDIDYLGEKLSFSGIGGVTTSLIARKQKLAGHLTATRIALDVLDGAIVCGLGMFEQGYYDKLGFGTGSYENIIHFSPSTLNIDVIPRVPDRITPEDWQEVHNSRLKRLRKHGSLNFHLPAPTRAEMHWIKTGFGYGYRNSKGELTHHIWMSGQGKEHGPFRLSWLNYQNYNQFLELLALLKSFGDQVHLVTLIEPSGIQFQDFLNKPFHYRSISEKSNFQNAMRSTAWWQMRICNLEECMKFTHLVGEEVSFNLILDDPIERFLDDDSEWGGISGRYIVTLGENSGAEKGYNDNLPTMKASVGAFTRMWLGVLPATGLVVSDQLSGDNELLKRLDKLIRLPYPKIDWEF